MLYLFPAYTILVASCLFTGGRAAPVGDTSKYLGRSLPQIREDLTYISLSLSKLNSSVQSFSGTRDEALGVCDDFLRLASSLEQGTSDVQNTPAPISDTDATNVMSYAQSFEPTLKSILKTAVDKKLDVLSLNFSNVSGFMKQGLTEFNRTTCTFGDALIGLFSDAMQPPAKIVKENIIQEFNSAYEKYAEQEPDT